MPDRARRWWPRSIRWRITAVSSLVVAAVLVLAVLALLGAERDTLTEQLDEALRSDAQRLVSALDTAGAEPTATALEIGGDDDELALLVLADGRAVVGADADADAAGDVLAAIAGRNASRDDVVATVHDVGPDGDAYRVLTQRVDAGILHVAAPLDDIQESLRVLTVTAAIGVPVVTALLAALIWLVVGRTLRPVERIRTEVAAIGPAELDRRVDVPTGGDEIARLAVTMNAMLGRLDAAAQRQRRFTADASHELRTPLTRMRAELETATDGDGAAPAELLAEVDAMQRLVDDLLALARGDEVDATPTRVVDLDDVVLEEVRALVPGAVAVDTARVSGAQVRGVPEQLRRAVRNLLDNAVHHARAAVTVELGEDGGTVTLAVDDDGPGVPAARRAEVFERFRRLDESRSGATGGTGLGLAIVRDVVTRHGGSVAVEDAPSGGARFVVTLPASA